MNLLRQIKVVFFGLIFTSMVVPSVFAASIGHVDLSEYSLSGTYSLPAVTAEEASAVTYNWDTDTLFVVGDEGEYIVEVDKTGVQQSVMALTGFDDTEGLTYVGGGRFVVTEERERDAYLTVYTAGGAVSQASLPGVDLGSYAGNRGIEGISYDPRDGRYITVKEKRDQEVNLNTIDFTSGSAQVTSLFTPDLGVSDLSDVQVLSTVSSLTGTADEDNLLIFSQESMQLLEVDRSGTILSGFDFSAISDSAEGVTIDQDGIIYIVAENGENPMLYTLSPNAVPLPGSLLLLWTALLGAASIARPKKA